MSMRDFWAQCAGHNWNWAASSDETVVAAGDQMEHKLKAIANETPRLQAIFDGFASSRRVKHA